MEMIDGFWADDLDVMRLAGFIALNAPLNTRSALRRSPKQVEMAGKPCQL